MHFASIVLGVRSLQKQTPLTAAAGVYTHAAVIHALSSQDESIARTFHDMGRNKCMTLAFVGRRNGRMLLRITCLSSTGLEYVTCLMNALSHQPTLRFGSTSCVLDTVEISGSEWTGISTWSDLLCKSMNTSIRLRFVAPTAIMKRNAAGHRFTSLYPDPRDVFVGLARRWQALGGPSLPLDIDQFIESGGCVVARHQLQTVEFQTAERTQIGFTGSVVYTYRQAEPSYIAALNALARFSFFSGVGYQTARGMGAVRPSFTE